MIPRPSGGLACEGFPAIDDALDVLGHQLHGVAAAAEPFGGDQGRPAASERVVDRLPGLRVVADRDLEERHRLLGGVPRVRIRAGRVAPKRVAVGNRPDGGLRPIALPPRRPTGAHGVAVAHC